MKTIKKPVKDEAPYMLKLWGLQLPLERPLTRKDVKQLFIAFLIFLLVLAVCTRKELWWAAGGISTAKAATWVKGLVSQKPPRSP